MKAPKDLDELDKLLALNSTGIQYNQFKIFYTN